MFYVRFVLVILSIFLLSPLAFAENYLIGEIVSVSDEAIKVQAYGNTSELKLANAVACRGKVLNKGSKLLTRCLNDLVGKEVQIIASDDNKVLEVDLMEEIPQ